MSVAYRDTPVIAVYPFSRGFGFVLFEGPDHPLDWGVKEITGEHRNVKTITELKKLIDRYRPEVLVIEETGDQRKIRSTRIKKLYRMLAHLAATEYIDVHRVQKSAVKERFALVGATTKYEIAKAISAQIPAFAIRMPRIRRPWMSQDSRQSLFDAAALALTYYAGYIESPYLDDMAE